MIIGFSGKKQSGKSTCVRALLEQGGFSEVNFADELKILVMKAFGASADQVYGSEERKNEVLACGKSVRVVMQEVGNKLREVDRNIWINLWLARKDRMSNEFGTESFLVGDVRYPNEVAVIHRLGGVVVRLSRALDNDRHESETALDDVAQQNVWFDAVIDNHLMGEVEVKRACVSLCEDRGWI